MDLTKLKTTATIVGAIAGIITGIDKIKCTLQKWHDEYSVKRIRVEPKELPDNSNTPS